MLRVVPALLLSWFSLLVLATHDVFTPPDFLNNVKRTAGGMHIPIHRRETRRTFRKRGDSSAIGLGDVQDITYNVLVQVGQVTTPLVLDTGSADLWVISDKCGDCNATSIPLYSQSSFQSSDLNVDLRYGDSRTGTHASGAIGKDTVGIAGLILENQALASINDTDTLILETGSAGIFGLGFPVLSSVWRSLLSQELAAKYPAKREAPEDLFHERKLKQSSNPRRIQTTDTTPVSYPEVFTSFATFGPLIARMVAQNSLASPMITIALQRDTVDIGGNMGVLSIGELPEGVKNESITWVPVPTYGIEQGGLAPPSDAMNEKYPLAWEIPIDGIYIDGNQLPKSTLVPNDTGIYALVDTGNSLIRGQQDLVTLISNAVGGDKFPCYVPHNLSFQIGGKMFPVDPRDFVQQSYPDSLTWCGSKLEVTDPPTSFLHSWSLGDPFLKSTLVVFYFGDLVYPSRDPPRMGFLSTVPSNAVSLFEEALGKAQEDNNLPLSSEAAPSGGYPVLTRGVDGVPQALHTGLPTLQDIKSAATSYKIDLPYTTAVAASLIYYILRLS